MSDIEIFAEGVENSSRKVQLIKVGEAYRLFKELIVYHGTMQLFTHLQQDKLSSISAVMKDLATVTRDEWINVGGQLMPKRDVDQLIADIHTGKVNSWKEVHQCYHELSANYNKHKMEHAVAAMLEILELKPAALTKKVFTELLESAITTREWMVKGIYESRAKDYASPFRKMLYQTEKEMEKVIGSLKDNSFILQQQGELEEFKKEVAKMKASLKA